MQRIRLPVHHIQREYAENENWTTYLVFSVLQTRCCWSNRVVNVDSSVKMTLRHSSTVQV